MPAGTRSLEGCARFRGAEARILELEAEVEAARLGREQAVADVHRSYRRDLVPLGPTAIVKVEVPSRRRR